MAHLESLLPNTNPDRDAVSPTQEPGALGSYPKDSLEAALDSLPYVRTSELSLASLEGENSESTYILDTRPPLSP